MTTQMHATQEKNTQGSNPLVKKGLIKLFYEEGLTGIETETSNQLEQEKYRRIYLIIRP